MTLGAGGIAAAARPQMVFIGLSASNRLRAKRLNERT
jgi:hypothetical protein